MVGEIVMVTPAELLLLPQPQAPNAAAIVSIVETFHQLIPVLPTFLNIRPRGTSFDPWRLSGLSSLQSHILNSVLQNPQSNRPAHREPERAHRIEEIGPLRIVEYIYNLRRNLRIPYFWLVIYPPHLGLVDVPRTLGGRADTCRCQIGLADRSRELRLGRRDDLGHPAEVVSPIDPERRLHDRELYNQFKTRRGARLEIRAGL